MKQQEQPAGSGQTNRLLGSAWPVPFPSWRDHKALESLGVCLVVEFEDRESEPSVYVPRRERPSLGYRALLAFLRLWSP